MHIGKKAPSFNAPAVVNGVTIDKFSLDSFLGKYVLFFFYPLDFTFVCPTELHAFQESLPEFHSRNAEVVACSVDSVYSHQAWLNTPKARGGIQGISYPIVSDINKTISRSWGVLNEEEGVAFRGTYLLDRQGIIRHALINDLPLGRSVDEALRMIDALTFFEKHGEVCPANWRLGSKAMKPTVVGVSEYFS